MRSPCPSAWGAPNKATICRSCRFSARSHLNNGCADSRRLSCSPATHPLAGPPNRPHLPRRKNFSAEKDQIRKEVTAMTYSKPELCDIAEATTAIRLDHSPLKTTAGAELTDLPRMTVSACSADEEG